ncbi:hypothetical protein [Rhodococcus yananensis]|uniref:hypothetical protein n=1 Tax=Rhodococcus yananensis TaxID=2879464 RepID=UPI001CF87052|nr:hypothetical protein [Rhodococcus yananensis]
MTVSDGAPGWFDHLLTTFDTLESLTSAQEQQARYAELAADLHNGVDPDYIQTFENFAGLDRAQLHAYAQSIHPEAMSTVATGWATLSAAASTAVSDHSPRMYELFESWLGGAGAEAATTTRLLNDSASQLFAACSAVSAKAQIATEVGEHVKTLMPSIPLPRVLLTPAELAEQTAADEDSRQEAVRLMETVYKPYYRDSGSEVPVLPSPFGTATSDYDDSGGGSVRGQSVSGGTTAADGSAGSAPDSSTAPSAQGSTTATTGSGNPDTRPDGTGSGTGSGSGTGQGAPTDPAATAPASTLPGATGTTGQPYGSTLGHPGSGTAGSGYGGGHAGGPSTLGPGATGGVGVPTAASSPPATAPSSGTAARTGMRPMGMYPGMVPPSRNDAGETRQNSGYLVTNENGNELIGDLPNTVPPVLGVDPL